METLNIYMFGSSIRLMHREEAVAQQLRPQAKHLLAYLLLYGNRPQPRESLLEVFWHDLEEERARRCLSTTLWRLRSALPKAPESPESGLLQATQEEVWLNPEGCYWLDVSDFEARVARAVSRNPADMDANEARDLESACLLYVGDLLETVYDEWALRERERLRLLYIRGLYQLIDFHFLDESYECSLEAALRVLALDPLREEVHQKVMQIYARTGQRSLALHQYAECKAILEQELGIEPMAETQALCAKIRAGRMSETESIAISRPASRHQLTQQLDQAIRALEDAQELLSRAIRLAGRIDQNS